MVRLVIFTSRFEATRGLFWEGSLNFEPRSDEDGCLSWHPSPSDVRLRRHRVYTADLWWNQGLSLESFGPGARDLTTRLQPPLKVLESIHTHMVHFKCDEQLNSDQSSLRERTV
ncbi:hypothetical protein AVEN_135766-1 [Araneus ventricosus]|uniref:Uncharacterized protein n=1 Tax=Araneus ventricosus TaxID=182803 RepID=A0A4Y2CAQ3_ARAVE|nr:hypothetical protein AVEN_135766-1 [Araneus ventricosus]